MNVLSLKSYATAGEAFNAIIGLYDSFKKTHGRGERVELYMAHSAPIAPRRAFAPFAPATFPWEVRCHYKTEDKEDAEWMKGNIR